MQTRLIDICSRNMRDVLEITVSQTQSSKNFILTFTGIRKESQTDLFLVFPPFKWLNELDAPGRFWWRSCPSVLLEPPPPSLTPPQHSCGSVSLISPRWARGELLYILQASPRTIPHDVLLSGACTDAALTSAIQEHRTQCSLSPPHFSYPSRASPGIISQMF